MFSSVPLARRWELVEVRLEAKSQILAPHAIVPSIPLCIVSPACEQPSFCLLTCRCCADLFWWASWC